MSKQDIDGSGNNSNSTPVDGSGAAGSDLHILQVGDVLVSPDIFTE